MCALKTPSLVIWKMLPAYFNLKGKRQNLYFPPFTEHDIFFPVLFRHLNVVVPWFETKGYTKFCLSYICKNHWNAWQWVPIGYSSFIYFSKVDYQSLIFTAIVVKPFFVHNPNGAIILYLIWIWGFGWSNNTVFEQFLDFVVDEIRDSIRVRI